MLRQGVKQKGRRAGGQAGRRAGGQAGRRAGGQAVMQKVSIDRPFWVSF